MQLDDNPAEDCSGARSRVHVEAWVDRCLSSGGCIIVALARCGRLRPGIGRARIRHPSVRGSHWTPWWPQAIKGKGRCGKSQWRKGRSTAEAALSVGATKLRLLLFIRLATTLAYVAVVLFCQCGSDRVDIKLWNVRRAQLHCLTCGQEAWLDGFTVSEFDPAKLFGRCNRSPETSETPARRSAEDSGASEDAVAITRVRRASPLHNALCDWVLVRPA